MRDWRTGISSRARTARHRLRLIGAISRRQRKRLRAASAATNGPPVTVHLRALGAPLTVRPGTTDAVVVLDAFARGLHLPPPEVDLRRATVIVDAGSNMGVAAAHFARLAPGARVIGFEPDSGTHELAERNIRPWADRCEIRRAAVWLPGIDSVAFECVPGDEWAAHVVGDGGTQTVAATSLDDIVAAHGYVDYLKLDVEGAEGALLSAGGSWTAQVACIKVEVHPPLRVADCVRDLEALGFVARADAAPDHVVGFGRRRDVCAAPLRC